MTPEPTFEGTLQLWFGKHTDDAFCSSWCNTETHAHKTVMDLRAAHAREVAAARILTHHCAGAGCKDPLSHEPQIGEALAAAREAGKREAWKEARSVVVKHGDWTAQTLADEFERRAEGK